MRDPWPSKRFDRWRFRFGKLPRLGDWPWLSCQLTMLTMMVPGTAKGTEVTWEDSHRSHQVPSGPIRSSSLQWIKCGRGQTAGNRHSLVYFAKTHVGGSVFQALSHQACWRMPCESCSMETMLLLFRSSWRYPGTKRPRWMIEVTKSSVC